MTDDPYPQGRPDPRGEQPYADDAYASDPYLPPSDAPRRPPAHDPGRPPAYPSLTPIESSPQPFPPPYGYGPRPPTPTNSSAVVLVVLSSVAMFTGYCCYIGIPGLIFGILGITQQTTDPTSAARMTKYGWISFGSLVGLTLLAIALFLGLVFVTES